MKWTILQVLVLNWIISTVAGDTDDDRVTTKTIPEETAAGMGSYSIIRNLLHNIPHELAYEQDCLRRISWVGMGFFVTRPARKLESRKIL